MSGGTFNVSRDLWDDTAFADEPFSEREAWLWLVSEASWKARERRVGKLVVDTERGQVAVSVRFMAERFKWSKSRVHRWLKRLEARRMVIANSGTGLMVVTICNYDKYQSQRDSSGTAAGQQRDKREEGGKKGNIVETNVSTSVQAAARVRQPVPHATDLSEAVEAYNIAAAKSSWPQVQKMGQDRSKRLRDRLADCGGIEGWRLAMDRAAASDFLCNRSPRQWAGATFDWLVKPANFTKLMEGNYDNRSDHRELPKGPNNRPDPAIEQIARLTGLATPSGYGGG